MGLGRLLVGLVEDLLGLGADARFFGGRVVYALVLAERTGAGGEFVGLSLEVAALPAGAQPGDAGGEGQQGRCDQLREEEGLSQGLPVCADGRFAPFRERLARATRRTAPCARAVPVRRSAALSKPVIPATEFIVSNHGSR